MVFNTPLHLSRGFLGAAGIHTSLQHRERLPDAGRIIVISNHRSLFDAPLLMAAMNRSVRFACHYYMSRVPVLREMVSAMGAFPLDAPHARQKSFFQKSVGLLESRQIVGIFPEGAKPMIQLTQRNQVGPFNRGFAHLALRAHVDDLAILPIAIASIEEETHNLLPLKLFRLVDPSEPLFDGGGWHYATVYRRVHLVIGQPIWIDEAQRREYRGRQGGTLAKELTHSCWNQINELLGQGCY